MLDLSRPIRTRSGKHVTGLHVVESTSKCPLVGHIVDQPLESAWTVAGKFSPNGPSSDLDLENYEPKPKPDPTYISFGTKEAFDEYVKNLNTIPYKVFRTESELDIYLTKTLANYYNYQIRIGFNYLDGCKPE